MGATGILYLTGMMGSGKTTVGKILAKRWGANFADTDRMVEEAEGHRVATLFRRSGEAYFRAAEKKALKSLTGRKNLVVATGGGLPVDAANLALMHASGRIVYLRAAPEALVARLDRKGLAKRPLLKVGAADLLRLSKEREKYYRQADIIVSAEASPGEVADRIERELAKEDP